MQHTEYSKSTPPLRIQYVWDIVTLTIRFMEQFTVLQCALYGPFNVACQNGLYLHTHIRTHVHTQLCMYACMLSVPISNSR